MVWSCFGSDRAGLRLLGSEDEADVHVKETVLQCEPDKYTPLYQAIFSAETDKDWERIVIFLTKGYWPGALLKDFVSPHDQARTWIRSKLNGRQLPIHLAIACMAPFKVLKHLVDAYPKGLRCLNDQYMLPLHIALRNNSPDKIVAYLIESYPESVIFKNPKADTPLESALQAKDTHRGTILQYFVRKAVAAQVAESELALAEISNSMKARETQFRAQLERKEMEMQDKLAATEAAWQKQLEEKVAETKARAEFEFRTQTLHMEADFAAKMAGFETDLRAECALQEAAALARRDVEFHKKMAEMEDEFHEHLARKEAEYAAQMIHHGPDALARKENELGSQIARLEEAFESKLARKEAELSRVKKDLARAEEILAEIERELSSDERNPHASTETDNIRRLASYRGQDDAASTAASSMSGGKTAVSGEGIEMSWFDLSSIWKGVQSAHSKQKNPDNQDQNSVAERIIKDLGLRPKGQ